MDTKRLTIGISVLIVVVGFLLLGLTQGGLFNKIVPWSESPGLRKTVYHAEAAYIDLSRGGPMTGLILIGLGGAGVIYGYARKEWP